MKYARVLLSVFVASWLVACQQPASPSLRVAEGQPFPELKLHTLQGQPASTAQFAGKVLVVNVWATWCPPCRKELPSLEHLAQQLDPVHYAVIGVSIDSDDHVLREFLIERKVTFPNFQDRDATNMREVLGVRAFPSTFIVRPDGTLYKVVEGAREWDSAAWLVDLKELVNAR